MLNKIISFLIRKVSALLTETQETIEAQETQSPVIFENDVVFHHGRLVRYVSLIETATDLFAVVVRNGQELVVYASELLTISEAQAQGLV